VALQGCDHTLTVLVGRAVYRVHIPSTGRSVAHDICR
jgi:hypothetical protein